MQRSLPIANIHWAFISNTIMRPLHSVVEELGKVMKNKSDLIFSISYENNYLTFNEGWKFDMNTLKKLFSRWTLVDYLIDNCSSSFEKQYSNRYTKDLSLDRWIDGEYRVIFLHFNR